MHIFSPAIFHLIFSLHKHLAHSRLKESEKVCNKEKANEFFLALFDKGSAFGEKFLEIVKYLRETS